MLLQDVEEGIKLNERINNIRFADYNVIFSNSLHSLQNLMDKITEKSRQYDRDININKSQFIIISKQTNLRGNISTDSREIKTGIEKARATFNKIFESHDLKLNTKISLL